MGYRTRVNACLANDRPPQLQVFAIGLLCFQPGAIGLDLFQRLAVALPAVGLGTFIGATMFARVKDRTSAHPARCSSSWRWDA